MNPEVFAIDPGNTAKSSARPKSLGLVLWTVAATVLIAGVLVGLISSYKFVSLPEASNGSLHDAGVILKANLTVLLVIGACTGFQVFARTEVEDGSRPWIAWLTTATIVVMLVVNVAALGVVIGELGIDALVRILPHAPFEATAFVLGINAFVKARRDELTNGMAGVLFGSAAVLLILGALVETYVSGGLS